MGRRKKTPNENQEESNSGAEFDSEIIPVEVETHEPQKKSLRERLTEKLSEVVTNEDGGYKSVDDLSPAGKRSREWRNKKKGQTTDLQSEFSTLVSSLFVVIVAVWNAPSEVKPNDDEINGVSLRVTRIVLRHIDISGRVTADVLDLIGILAISASYYSRVAPSLRELNKPKIATVDREVFYRDNGGVSSEEAWVTPIEQADPGLKNWLDGQAEEG